MGKYFITVVLIICAFLAGLHINVEKEYTKGYNKAMRDVFAESWYYSGYSQEQRDALIHEMVNQD